MTNVTLVGALISFAARAGFTPQSEGAVALTLANEGGEIRYTISRGRGGHVLSSAERSEEAQVLMWAGDLRYIEAMLARSLAVALRSREGLAPVRLPFGWGEAAAGFQAVGFQNGWTGLSHGGMQLPLEVVDRSPIHPVVQLSYLLGGSFNDVLRSLSSSDGAPLLSPYVRRSRR